MTETKKKKKISSSQQIKKLREKIRNSDEWGESMRAKWWEMQCQNKAIFELFPKKYYEVVYKAKAKSGALMEFKNCVSAIHPKLAIDEVRKSLVDFQLLLVKEVA
jgi:hypothetical protein